MFWHLKTRSHISSCGILSSPYFFNLSSFSQTPLPEWEWKVRVNQGVIAHHSSQCYSKCYLWFRVPDPKKTCPWLQSVGTVFNARLLFLLQVHVTAMSGILKGTFEEADSTSLCSSVQESDDEVFSCDSAENLDSISLSTLDHLPVSIWSCISCFPSSTSFLDGSFLGASAYFTAVILLPSSLSYKCIWKYHFV